MSRRQILIATAGLAAAVAAGFGLGRAFTPPPSSHPAQAPADTRKPLYWYDPMVPAQHFDKPGKSPFMDMQLVPKYAGEAAGGAGVRVDPATIQSLGVRTAAVARGTLPGGVTATGVLGFDERDVAVVQARASGFVQRTYRRAPADVVPAGAPLADLLIPDWAGAQAEFLALKATGDPALVEAGRERLRLLGMPASLIANVERTGKTRNVVTVTTPTGGMVRTLTVRDGMTVAAGETLAEVNGLGRVWLDTAVPEAQGGEIRQGQAATAILAAFPGETIRGRVIAILPQADAASRTLTARIELPNPGLRLRPGMFATVQFDGAARPALLVPSEAVIRTGRRALVMLAKDGGRYLPAEVRLGREAGGRTEVLAGLAEGERVVASGQFLLDSEASLSDLRPRPLADGDAPAASAAPFYETVGRVEEIAPDHVTLSHDPVPDLNWPAMTMRFALGDPGLARGLAKGDRVRFGFEQATDGPVVRHMTKAAAQ